MTKTIRSFEGTQVFEFVLSEFNKLVVTAHKSTFPKSPLKIITHRSFKNISNDLLRDDLNSLLRKENMNLQITSLTSFTKILKETLKKHAPIKKKYICANHANFVTKDVRKVIMLRSRLRNIFLKKDLKSKNLKVQTLH